jgi:hypothetical protein
VKRPRRASREAYMAWIARIVSGPEGDFLLKIDEGAVYGAYLFYREGRLEKANRILGMTLAPVYSLNEEQARRLEKVAAEFGVWREVECVERPPIILAQLSLLPYEVGSSRKVMGLLAKFLNRKVAVLILGEYIWGEGG